MAKRNYTVERSGPTLVYVRTANNGAPDYGYKQESRKIEILIDWPALLNRLGSSAANSKRGESVALGGIIKAKEVR